jgi:hypothetical protein
MQAVEVGPLDPIEDVALIHSLDAVSTSKKNGVRINVRYVFRNALQEDVVQDSVRDSDSPAARGEHENFD